MAGDAQTKEKTTPTFATKATQFADKLTILQWNADALLSKIEELRRYIEEKYIDIFMIQEKTRSTSGNWLCEIQRRSDGWNQEKHPLQNCKSGL